MPAFISSSLDAPCKQGRLINGKSLRGELSESWLPDIGVDCRNYFINPPRSVILV
jgi:hypothetical protein